MKYICLFSLLFVSGELLAQKYKIKDGGESAVYVNLFGKNEGGAYDGQYIKELNDQKGFFPHGNGHVKAHIGNLSVDYVGDFFEGQISGTGKMETIDWIYIGSFKNGLPEGNGEWTWKLWSDQGYVKITGSFSNGLVEGKAKALLVSGNVYEGNFKNGLFHGQGILTYIDGSIAEGKKGVAQIAYPYYEGNFEQGKKSGIGQFYYLNGEKLDGNWKDDKFCGKGVLTNEEEDRYSGDFYLGVPHGSGVMNYSNGSIYNGQWENGNYNGKGKFTKANGTVKDGEFAMGKFSGFARIYFDDGAFFEGQILNDEYAGKGKYISASGKTIEGEFLNSSIKEGIIRYSNGDYYKGTWDASKVFHGTARVTAGNKSIWEGEWEGDLPISKGKVTFQDGRVYEGEWSGYEKEKSLYYELNGQGIMRHPDGGYYQGRFVSGWPSGQGKSLNPSGDLYDGEWKNGVKSGYGTMTYGNGDAYTGNWENDARNGYGTLKMKNGDVYEGEWLNNTKHGNGVLTYANGTVEKGEFENDRYYKIYDCPTTTLEGGKVFMAKNLDVRTFRNGDAIKFISSENEWIKSGDAGEPACCCYEYKSENCKKYGLLYNYWATIDPRGLAPRGWRIMNEGDIKTLQRYTNESLRTTTGWKEKAGTNTAHLNLVASGIGGFFEGQPDLYYFRESHMNFREIGEGATFWYSSNDANYTTAPYWDIDTNEIYYGLYESMKSGLSVRCVKEK
ncbi:MAG: hypothetical protein RL092_465 [Bacteroidota bacterium]|jgi:uncharacterized protein (TIGR02145 family)